MVLMCNTTDLGTNFDSTFHIKELADKLPAICQKFPSNYCTIQVLYVNTDKLGQLQIIMAIEPLNLANILGGCQMQPYQSSYLHLY